MSDKQSSDTKPSPANLRMVSNERGAVLALVALLLVVFLGLAALAIDLGLLYVARGEAQRAADAAAHAGAGHLMLNSGDEEGARDRAVQLAGRNSIRGQLTEIRRDEDIDVMLDEYKVRARVHRTDVWGGPIRTLFAGVLGFDNVNVTASAAAQSFPAGGAECVLPIAIPDRWCEEGSEGDCTAYPEATDSFDPDDGDFYVPWIRNPEAHPDDWVHNPPGRYTGYSDENRGDTITIRPPTQGGQESERWHPGWWNTFVYEDEDGRGNPPMVERILGCRGGNDRVTQVGQRLNVAPGARQGPIPGAFNTLVNDPELGDPDAHWNKDANDGRGCVTTKGEDECRGSVRLRPIVTFNPELGPKNPSNVFHAQNLAGIFIEDVVGSGNNLRIIAIFVEYTGVLPLGAGIDSGTLNRTLRIVE